jgi:hypothetical protein
MRTRHHTVVRRRASAATAGLFGLVLGATARAGEISPGPHVRPELYAAGITSYENRGGDSSGFDTMAITGELTVYDTARPYWGGPFVDYRYSTSPDVDDSLNLGVYFRYNNRRWDATGWLFSSRSSSTSTWAYATRLRYRTGERSKLGIESSAPLGDAIRPKLMFGYYGSLSESLSLNLLAGGHSAGARYFAARAEMVWQLR